ncbi:alpha/beta hydrolase family protein [Sphaerisporangium corydalis]|uniref:Alpha/beta hydrolase family protein n=1 Tax=Sphaerisporangium corydalis TaxID=1441875 RepID=A0ABV9ETQ7_9ACTN|nr:hypothetical protein [Sphaerisporangium corydalis]
MVLASSAFALAATPAYAGPATPAYAGPAALSAPAGLAAAEVSFTAKDGVVLHGTVIAPAPAPGSGTRRRAALVMMEGAGNRGRGNLLPEAEAFARRGIVTLIYDKRTVGYSLVHRDYSVLADDALAGLRLLRSRADVDPGRLGLWALSEGAFAAPLAASRSADVKFLITVGAVGIAPAAQTAWQYGEYLRHAGVSGSLPHTLQSTAIRMTMSAGIFPEANFDPAPAWERVRQPVLAQWGALDRQAIPQESGRIIRQALERGGNTRHTIRIVPGLRHNLQLTADGGFDRIVSLPPDYGAYEASWIERSASARPGTSAGPAPADDLPVPTFTPPAWYESPWWELVAFLVFLVGFAGYPVTAVVRRVRGRRSAPPARRPARWLAALGLATTLGGLAYVLFMLATAANVIGPVVAGHPIPWLVLRLLAVATVVTTAACALSWRRHRRDMTRGDKARVGLLIGAGLVFLPWAVYWGLLV